MASVIPLTVLASSTAPVARRRAMWKIESAARLATVGRIETDGLMSQIDRGCVKTHFARRVGSLTGELGVRSRLKLHLRG